MKNCDSSVRSLNDAFFPSVSAYLEDPLFLLLRFMSS